jgi:hypothetical protein
VRIELATQLTNESALALYESEGFARDTEFLHLSRTTGSGLYSGSGSD